MKFNENLKYLRKKEGLTQEELAEKLNVSRQAITKWESGLALPDISNIMEIADMFGVSIDTLLKDEKVSKNTTLNKKAKDLPLLLFGFALYTGMFVIDSGINNIELVIAVFMISIILIGFSLKNYFLGREIIDLTNTKKGRKERIKIIITKSISAEIVALIYLGIIYVSRKMQGLEVFNNSMDLVIGSVISLIIYPVLLTLDMKSKCKKYTENKK